jgi:hypothetical protein
MSALILASALAACGSSNTANPAAVAPSTSVTLGATAAHAPSASGRTATAAPTITAPATTARAVTGETAAHPTTPACDGRQLSVAAAPLGAALSHAGFVVVFTNSSPMTCTLVGYPGAAGLDASGKQVMQASRAPAAYLGGLLGAHRTPVRLTLHAGQKASATVQGTSIPSGRSTACPTLAATLITAPNTQTSVRVANVAPDCSGLIVTPVVPGSSGRSLS